MKRRFFLALCLLSALATGSAKAQSNALRISYVRSPFNLQLMMMKEKGILQKHLTPLGLQAQWPEINSGAKQAQALASGDLYMGGVMNTTSVLLAEGEGNPVRIVAGVSHPTDVFAIVAGKNGPRTVAELKGKTIAGPKGKWIQVNKEDAIALGAKLQNISVDEARQLYNWSYFTQRLKPSDFQAMEKDVQFMLDNGMMRNRVDVRKIVAPGALEATAK